MWVAILQLIFGFIALLWSADRFVISAAVTANNLGISKVLIGLTVVSIGTSAPEILVGIMASLDGSPTLAIGNAIGSNIANIGLVLGITAIITQLPFAPSVLRSELPWLIGATTLALICLFNLHLGVLDGLALLAGLGFILFKLTQSTDRDTGDLPDTLQDELDDLPEMTTRHGVVWLVVGLIVLLIASKLLTEAAITIADILNVDEIIIGLTVIAIGTSLPELAATVTAAVRGQSDIAIGNVVGSNILNILAVMAVPALIHPIDIEGVVLLRDFAVMLALTMMLVLFAYGIGSRKVITQFEGLVLVAAWIGYNVMLYHQSTSGG